MEFFNYLIGGLLVIILVYAVVRGASFAYFRSKYAYFRAVMKEMRKGERDGF